MKGGGMKDEGLFGRGGKRGGGRGGVKKGGGGGCCNTATYSTGEGEGGERKKAKGGKVEWVVAVIQ